MKLTNAIKKLEKYAKVTKDGIFYQAKKNGKVIEFVDNGGMGTITAIKVRRDDDHNDSMSDYTAGCFYNTLGSAIKSAGFMKAAA